MSTSIIVGVGEVGSALEEVLSFAHRVYTYDPKHDDHLPFIPEDSLTVLHICFGYTPEAFEKAIEEYQRAFTPKYTIVHSTTPVGVCRGLGVYHSPVRGIHPHLAESMRTFTTYLAPRNMELVDYLSKAGMCVQPVPNSDETEAGKLWCLAAYAWSIVLEKEIHQYCRKRGLDFKVVYKHFTHTYNEGYEEMGMGQFVRPVLEHMDGEIGGHCVIPAAEKLAGDSEVARLILEFNKAYGNS